MKARKWRVASSMTMVRRPIVIAVVATVVDYAFRVKNSK
jgi:hypothetical protein